MGEVAICHQTVSRSPFRFGSQTFLKSFILAKHCWTRRRAIMRNTTRSVCSTTSSSNSNDNIFQLTTNPLTGEAEWVVIRNETCSSGDQNDAGLALAYTSYLDMLNDFERNRAYDLAIRKAIRGPCHVLDIGAGTGLLSMMSFRAMNVGASQLEGYGKECLVTTCESYLPMFKLARKVLTLNGLNDKIQLIYKRSEDLLIGTDLPRRVDVLVSEVLDSELLGEGIIPTLQHAHDHLLMPNAHTIPYKATVYGQLVQSELLGKMHGLHGDEFCISDKPLISRGFSHFLKQSQHAVDCDAFAADIKTLSEPFKVFDFDFWRRPEDTRDIEVNINTSCAGRANAIISWWVLQLDIDGTIFYSTAPRWIMSKYENMDDSVEYFGGFSWRNHWKHCVWFLPGCGINVSSQDQVIVRAFHNAVSLMYDVKKKNIPHGVCFHKDKGSSLNIFMRPERVSVMTDKEWRSALLAVGKQFLQGRTSSLVLVVDDSIPLTLLSSSLSSASKIISMLPGFGAVGYQYLCTFAKKNELSLANTEVLGKPASQLSMDDTGGKKIDVLVAEPFYIANEGLLPWQNLRFWKESSSISSLLSENAIILPLKGKLQGCAMWLPDLWRSRCSLKDVEGFDHFVANEILGACGNLPISCKVPILPYAVYQCGQVEMLSQEFTLMEFQFTKQIQKVTGIATVPFSKSGLCHGFAFWMDWIMDPTHSVVVSSKPGLIPAHKQGVKLLRQPVKVRRSNQNSKEEHNMIRDVDSFDTASLAKLHGSFDPCTGQLEIEIDFLNE